MLVDNLLTLGEGVIENDLRRERNRLLGLGHELAGGQARTVLDDAWLRLLSGFLFGYLSVATLGGELGGVGLLAVLTFLNNPGFTRLQVRVLTHLSRVRDRNRPRHVLGALSRLGADEHDLVDRLLGALPSAFLVLLFRARLTLGFNLVLAGRNGVVVLVLDLERNFTSRNIDDVHYRVSSIRRTIFVGHRDRNLDLVAGLRVCGSSRGDLAVVVNADLPTGRHITQLVWVFLRDVDVVRLIQSNRQLSGLARVHGLYGIRRFGFPVIRQLHHAGDGHLRGGTVGASHRDGDGLLVARLRTRRRRSGDLAGLRVDRVLPAVDLLLGDGLTVLDAEGERGALGRAVDLVRHRSVRACRFHGVAGDSTVRNDRDRAGHLLRFHAIAVVREHGNVEHVAFLGARRDGRGELASVLVDRDGPVTIGVGEAAVREGVAGRGSVIRATGQPLLGNTHGQGHLVTVRTGHGGVLRHLDVLHDLELHLDLIGGLVRVGRGDLRGDHGTGGDRVVGLRRDVPLLVHRHGPTARNGRGINFEFRRRDCLLTLHDGFRGDLRGERRVRRTLRHAGVHEVRDLRIVRVNRDEQRDHILRPVRVRHDHSRLGERARGGVLRGGHGHVVRGAVELDIPALVHVAVVKRDRGLLAAVPLLLDEVSDPVGNLREGHRLASFGERALRSLDAGDDGGVRLVIPRIVVHRVIQRERLAVDHVWRVVALQRIGLIGDDGESTAVIALESRVLKLLHRARLRDHREVHVLLASDFALFLHLIGIVRVAVRGPRVENIAVLVHAQEIFAAARGFAVARAEELSGAVIRFNDDAGKRIVGSLRGLRHIDVPHLGFFTRNDHVLLRGAIPRHRDRVTVHVFARPRVHGCLDVWGIKNMVGAFRIVLFVSIGPQVPHGLFRGCLRILLDLLTRQLWRDGRGEGSTTKPRYRQDLVGLVRHRFGVSEGALVVGPQSGLVA